MAGQIDANFFLHYAQVADNINALKHVDQLLQQAQGLVSATTERIRGLEGTLAKAYSDEKRYDKRIHRNENPRFFHYFVIKRAAKVERLKGERDALKGRIGEWTNELDSQRNVLEKETAELNRVKDTARTRDAYVAERNDMYERAVSTCPSPRLQQIQSNIAAQTQAKGQEANLLQRVNNVVQMLNQGQGMYNEAMRMLQEAHNLNQNAQMITQFERIEDEEERRRLERAERDRQMRRDRLINEAQGPANQAYMLISNAWSQFPPEARQRYPTLAMQIGQTPLVQLKSASQGETMMMDMLGNFGETINNSMSERKIRENMDVVRQCQEILRQQTGLVQALVAAIGASVAQMDGQLHTLEAQKKEEKDNIFVHLRNSVLGSMQQTPQIQAAQAIPCF
mmetsp:Transcript_30546/g.48912  ORF Transcript_30546/g.48912 Transcript_30546/m.48912 type:complete len:396 (+) Transcript_30546:962-2149(+)|eukprot:CAMPEP_0203763922 /NCGR_PEP_ID=MMETSP0098-20131031/17100_1 /ASSEMBLY_ACC=CAM_ASM_000208 /TAXON_ID=96639 /ORGANISM=" , Strain NY0313808BC1" /LENGTH=395 /DNA_ID=CAMNT_0050659315 /DNA_START=1443 /DNA_END=2630 /DNA_ORIENTATION=-